MKKKSILLIGEHSLLRAFLRAWLVRFKNLEVVAESDDAKHALELVAKNNPSLVLMDFDTLQSASLDVLSKMHIRFPKTKVIIFFAAQDQVAVKVIRAGADGFVVKSSGSAEMETAIKTVMQGGVYLSPEFLRSISLTESLTDTKGKPLSPRQNEILKLVALGMTTKAIGFELKISGKTVDVHKQAIVSRLGLKKTSELFRYTVSAGLAAD